MEKVILYGSIINAGDGSAYVRWYLTEEAAINSQERQNEGWAEECIEEIETFVGSQTWKDAAANGQNDE